MTTQKAARQGKREANTVYIASDHAGYDAKNALRDALLKRGVAVTDLGPAAFNKNDDYPVFAKRVTQEVVKNSSHRGILLCGSGQGMCIAANKVRGIRAAIAWNSKTAQSARNDDDANILCLSARLISRPLALRIALTWLNTPFSKLARHKRRIGQIE
ncbi:MAG: RpiB/LacA/LacB family sugar-phosphate isomerase [bacterium]|nr:RpiB/LacA/LacB family sugar-phosphate isomerase [bacterium]